MRLNLRIPGPIPVPDDILAEMAHPMINHRGPEFKEMLFRVTDGLKQVFETKGDVYIMTTSGTGAMEAAVVNTLSPGDRVLCVTVGSFGDRFGEIAAVYGADVVRLEFPWGTAADPDKVREALRKDPKIKAVLVTHNETSTGVGNELEAIARVASKEFDKLILVDGVSSVASIPVRTDAWGLDVVATASQKGWMLPPGLAFVSLSQRAWKAHATAKMPRYYFDASAYKRYFEIGQPPYTPGVSLYFALDLALKQLLAEGLPSVYARHTRIAQMTRDGAKSMGLSLFPDERVASETVTAVKVPEGVDAAKVVATLREQHGVVLAGGQERLKGKIFRIGHMGRVSPEEIRQTLAALGATLPKAAAARV